MTTKHFTVSHVGWFSAMNFGDDLMAEALYENLQFDEVLFDYHLVCDDRPTIKGENLTWIYPMNLKKRAFRNLYLGIRKPHSDLIIVGGGSILRSSNGIAWKHDFFKSQRKSNPKIILSGFSLSIGDFLDSSAETKAKEFIKEFDFAYLRDQFSFDFYKQYNSGGQAVLSFDAGASLLRQGKTKIPDTVGMCLMKPQDADEDIAYRELLSELRLKGFKITHFIFMGKSSFEDIEYAELVKTENELVISYSGDIPVFIERFNEMENIVSSRFHGMVLAYSMSKPFIGIPPKRVIKKGREVFNSFQNGFGDTNVLLVEPGFSKEAVQRLENRPLHSEEIVKNSQLGIDTFKSLVLSSLRI